MKKLQLFAILVLLLTKIANADSIISNEKQKIDTVKTTIQYKEAVRTFEVKDYQQAFILFEQLINQYPNNKFVNFYYGRAAYELKNYEYAFTSFDRILINHPQDGRVRAEYARTLMMLHSYDEAKKEFEKILLTPIPPKVRENIEKMIKIVKSKDKNYILNRVLIVGLGWDNNVNNNTYESYTQILGGLELDNNTDKKSDLDLKTILVGNLIVPNRSNEHIAWETTALIYAKEQNKYHENDIFLSSFESGIAYADTKYKNLTSLGYEYIWLGGEKTLRTYAISNKTKYNAYKKQLLEFNVKYKRKRWIQQIDNEKNSRQKELSINYKIPFETIVNSVDLFSSYIEERKEHGSRVDISKDTLKYKINFTKNFFDSYTTKLSYQLEKIKYKDQSSFFSKRDDDANIIVFGITKQIDTRKSITLEYNNIDNDSNINTYTYKKQSVNLNYTLVF